MPGPVPPEELARLLDRHSAALALYARQLCDCQDDVVQEAFIELAGQRESPQEPAAWLYRVVRNRAIGASRSGRRRQRREAAAARDTGAWFVAADSGLDAEEATAALASLPDESREVVVAHLWGGLSFVEIGRLTGTSDSTAHRRYQEALSTLRDKLGAPCPKPTNRRT